MIAKRGFIGVNCYCSVSSLIGVLRKILPYFFSGTVMPVLQLHLVLCTTFTAAANKYQFLELCPSLIDRLAAVGNLSQPVRSLQSSQIKTNYRSEFAQCLEPWIGAAAVSQHQSELAASK